MRPGPGAFRRCLTVVVVGVALFGRPAIRGQSRDQLPAALTDAEFWSLTGRISETDGFFRSNSGSTDNLLSNEDTVSTVAAALATRVKPGGVYLGVGPEQNFTYIAAMRPRIAFITDIRRGNLHLHLLYKALFELSINRADFVARLFTRARPSGLTADSSAAVMMNASRRAARGDAAAFAANLKAVVDHLKVTRHLPLDADDVAGIEYVYGSFYRYGPDITYTSTSTNRSGFRDYATIVTSRDEASGAERTFLANETLFGVVKALESRNLVVPIVGDFAGPKALRALGAYLRAHGVTVTAFYVSNVEMYLERNGVWPKFCANAATLPLDADSVFIRPGRFGGVFSPITNETAPCRNR
jgi:hypothetical protein